jgi:uncharacterized membrane protein
MTKNTTREVHDKHTQLIRNGTLPYWKEDVKQDSSVTELTKSQSLAASTVITSPGDSSISTDSVKSRTSRQLLEKRAGGQAACVLLQDPSCMQDMRNTWNKIQKEVNTAQV